jgi:hypothetical protein
MGGETNPDTFLNLAALQSNSILIVEAFVGRVSRRDDIVTGQKALLFLSTPFPIIS